jgi:hypothetical protein
MEWGREEQSLGVLPAESNSSSGLQRWLEYKDQDKEQRETQRNSGPALGSL